MTALSLPKAHKAGTLPPGARVYSHAEVKAAVLEALEQAAVTCEVQKFHSDIQHPTGDDYARKIRKLMEQVS